MARGPHQSIRAKKQDYQTFFQYLSVDYWHTLGGASVSEHAKLELLVGAALGLGGRSLNEDTFAMMTALHLLAMIGNDAIPKLIGKPGSDTMSSRRESFVVGRQT